MGLKQGIAPAVHGNGAIEVHGGAGQNQQVGTLLADFADAHSAQIQEMLLVQLVLPAFYLA